MLPIVAVTRARGGRPKVLNNPFTPFAEWLEWLDTPDGLEYRRSTGGEGGELDRVATLPTPPGSTILTVADLRALVQAGREIDRLKRGDFTEEEFQALCHNFSEDDEARFKAGCEAYQRKLFGGGA
jgi:hypothetical protein